MTENSNNTAPPPERAETDALVADTMAKYALPPEMAPFLYDARPGEMEQVAKRLRELAAQRAPKTHHDRLKAALSGADTPETVALRHVQGHLFGDRQDDTPEPPAPRRAVYDPNAGKYAAPPKPEMTMERMIAHNMSNQAQNGVLGRGLPLL